MKLRFIFSFVLIMGFASLMGQTYQKLSTLERSAVPGMFPLTKTTSGQNIMVYARFDTAVNGAVDTTLFVLYSTFLDSLAAVSDRQTWLKPELEAGSVAINSAGGFQIDSLTILQFNSRRTGGTANARLLLSSQTSIPSRLLSFNPADTSQTAELVLDFDATSYFSAITAEIQARGGTAKLSVNDTIATVFGTFFLDKYQSPFDYLGSPAALLGVNGLGEVWPVDPAGFGNGIYGGSGSLPGQVTVTQGANKLILNATPVTSGEFRPSLEIRSQDDSNFNTSSYIKLWNQTRFGAQDSSALINAGQTKLIGRSVASIFVPRTVSTWEQALSAGPSSSNTGAIFSVNNNAVGSVGGQASLQTRSLTGVSRTAFLDINGFTVTDTTGIRLFEADAGNNWLRLRQPFSLSSNISLTLPSTVGTAGQFLQTNGANPATLSWATASGGATDLTFTGASSPVTLNSSTGTDVTLTAGTNVTFSQASNNLTINATGDGNGIYGGSGTIPNATGASCAGTFQITSTLGGLYFSNAVIPSIGTFNGNRFSVNAAGNLYSFGDNLGATTKASLQLFNQNDDYITITTSDTTGLWTFTYPPDAGAAGQVLVTNGVGVTTWEDAPPPPVQLSFTVFSPTTTVTAGNGDGGVVIPASLVTAGYKITAATYRTFSAVSIAALDVELEIWDCAGDVNDVLAGSIATTQRCDDVLFPAGITVAANDLILCNVGAGTAVADGLFVTITLEVP